MAIIRLKPFPLLSFPSEKFFIGCFLFCSWHNSPLVLFVSCWQDIVNKLSRNLTWNPLPSFSFEAEIVSDTFSRYLGDRIRIRDKFYSLTKTIKRTPLGANYRKRQNIGKQHLHLFYSLLVIVPLKDKRFYIFDKHVI